MTPDEFLATLQTSARSVAGLAYARQEVEADRAWIAARVVFGSGFSDEETEHYREKLGSIVASFRDEIVEAIFLAGSAPAEAIVPTRIEALARIATMNLAARHGYGAGRSDTEIERALGAGAAWALDPIRRELVAADREDLLAFLPEEAT